jgi:hypothetical protein
MSRRPEQRLWDRLRKAAMGKVHTERIENIVGVGRPDVDTLVAGSFVPVELKQVDGWPKRVNTRVLGDKGLSQVQKNWHLIWRRWGGTSLIVVGVGDEVFAFSGERADEINEYNSAEFANKSICSGLAEVVNLLVDLGEKR